MSIRWSAEGAECISPLQGWLNLFPIRPRGVAPGYYISRLQREERNLVLRALKTKNGIVAQGVVACIST